MRQPSMSASAASTGHSPALLARVNEKKAELERLKELKELSAAMASQMEALEQKLATLSDGTEGWFLFSWEAAWAESWVANASFFVKPSL